jgi:phosphoglycolate phosphatase-like HAD superfamily hydrolase
MERTGSSQAIYVGDTVDDMEAACAAGIPAVGIVNDPESRKSQREVLIQAGAMAVLDDVNEIMEVLR